MAIAMNYSNDFGFDVIEYVKKLRNVGVTQEIAEVQGQELSHAIKTMANEVKADIKQELHSDELATKGDIALARAEIRESELRLQKEISQSSNKMIIWLGGLLVASGLIQHFFK